jgi:MYXO-CTERM domain-containing protein
MLTWSASTDDVAVAGYELWRCSGAGCDPVATVAMPSGTTYLDGALAAATTYRYRVRALDTSGNASEPSAVAEATTLDGVGGPDAGASDGGAPRDGAAGSDGGTGPAGGGCGCRASRAGDGGSVLGALGLALLVRRRRWRCGAQPSGPG